jgi:hypothetical protein
VSIRYGLRIVMNDKDNGSGEPENA